jgi:Uma2 family endonuclease
MTMLAPTISLPKGFPNGIAWLRSLGDIPLERVVFDPWPGFATENDVIQFVEGDHKRLCELVDATLVEKPLGNRESIVAVFIATALQNFVASRKLGYVFGADAMMRTRPERIRLPDVSFIRAERLEGAAGGWTAIFAGAPDLAVEVISPGNSKAEMQQKLEEYFAAGTSLVWYVYPKDQTVHVHTSADAAPTILASDATLSGGDLLPGFSVQVRTLFPKETV